MKLKIVLIVFIVIIGISAVVFYSMLPVQKSGQLSPQQIQTIHWLTFSNQYISIQYPDNWVPPKNPNVGILPFKSPDKEKEFIFSYIEKNQLTPKDPYADVKYTWSNGGKLRVSKERQITIDGVNAQAFDLTKEDDTTETLVVVDHPMYFAYMVLIPADDFINEQMLMSLKLLK